MDENEKTGASFADAVLDMGLLFQKMKKQYQIPPAVTMDIVRLQLMYMQQSQMISPDSAPPEAFEVIEGEEEDIDE